MPVSAYAYTAPKAWTGFPSGFPAAYDPRYGGNPFLIDMKFTQNNKRSLIHTAIIAAVIALDQLTKFLAVEHLKPIDTFPIIPDALHLTYVTNYGAAFGMLADHRWVFLVISTVAIVLMAAYLYYKRDEHPLLGVAVSFIIGGGIGNMIDRTLMGYVVDFVDFRLINFAVFNVADIFVCVGCGLMFLWLFKFAEFDDEKKPEKKSAVTESAEESDDASDR